MKFCAPNTIANCWLPPLTLALLTALAFSPVTTSRGDTRTPPVDKEQAELPFQGKVEAVDATSRTLTVGGKVLSITGETKIRKGTVSINLSDVKVGDSASGMARQGFNGKTDAVSISIEEKKVLSRQANGFALRPEKRDGVDRQVHANQEPN